MNQEKFIPILKGLIKHVPGVKKMLSGGTGGTTESRYCYSIWMRHLMHWSSVHSRLPETVIEIGPGDSLGVGLAALLSGSSRLYALDVVKYWDNQRNVQVFEALVELFGQKAAIPDASEYPNVKPLLTNYEFPASMLTDQRLSQSLSPARINSIRKELSDPENPQNTFIKCQVPWNRHTAIAAESADFIYSQAVLEYVSDLDETFGLMKQWLKPAGLMSHTIDFKSHGLTPSWNGHWTLSDLEWRIVKGGQKFLLNREPVSTYVDLHKKHGFSIIKNLSTTMKNNMRDVSWAKKFKHLSEEDKTTSGAYMLSVKD